MRKSPRVHGAASSRFQSTTSATCQQAKSFASPGDAGETRATASAERRTPSGSSAETSASGLGEQSKDVTAAAGWRSTASQVAVSCLAEAGRRFFFTEGTPRRGQDTRGTMAGSRPGPGCCWRRRWRRTTACGCRSRRSGCWSRSGRRPRRGKRRGWRRRRVGRTGGGCRATSCGRSGTPSVPCSTVRSPTVGGATGSRRTGTSAARSASGHKAKNK